MRRFLALGDWVLTPSFLLAMLISSACFAESPNPKTMRLYTNGPLTIADYSSKPADAPPGFGAMTDTELRYHTEYEFVANPVGISCRVKKLVFYAVLAPKTSWADPNRIEALLDHEQGHFDITHKHALLAKKLLEPKALRKQLSETAPTAELARDLLAKRLAAEVKPFSERGIAENKAYDEATRHGTLAEAQAEWRERQKLEIAELENDKSKKATTKKKQTEANKSNPPATTPKSAP
jgi:hypothetical protein